MANVCLNHLLQALLSRCWFLLGNQWKSIGKITRKAKHTSIDMVSCKIEGNLSEHHKNLNFKVRRKYSEVGDKFGGCRVGSDTES